MRPPSAAPSPSLAPRVGRDLRAWRTRVLEGILRGILLLWMFALASGINNLVKDYRAEAALGHNPLPLAITVAVIYVAVTALLAAVTFFRNIRYNLRAGALLLNLYILGAVGMALASFSGDGRIFLFAFVVLSAVFFERRISLSAFALSLLTLFIVGYLQLTGVLFVPVARQANATDLGAWISGGLAFIILSVAALISISYLLGALGQSLAESRRVLGREGRVAKILRTLSEVNQLIVRERDASALLQQACEKLIAGRGYSFVWIGLLEADGLTLRLAASAGLTVDAAQFALRLDRDGIGPTCAAQALRSRTSCRVPEDDPCCACPLLSRHPQRASLALPLIRADRDIGVLVVDHTAPSAFFDAEEIALLKELANDLAYALDILRAEEQQRALVEVSGALLFARDEDMLWMEVITAVQKILRADRVAIYRHDRETDRLSCPRYHGLSAEYVNEINRRFHSVPGSAILSNPAPVVIQDVESDPAVAALRAWMLREGFRSYAVFPFYTSKGMSGAFVAYRNAPGPFTSSDLNAGGTLVRMIGLALENTELIGEARRRASKLGALYAAAQDMASSMLDTDALLQALARHTTEALRATSAYISAVDIASGLQRVAAEYWSADAADTERKSDLGGIYSVDAYPTFRSTLTDGKAAILHDDNPHCSEAERRQFAEYGVRSMLYVPVMARGKIQGGLEIWESRRKREFTQSEIALAQSIAGHAASIINNAQLFADLAEAYDNTLTGWARALELRDEPTEGHTRRVTDLSLQMARAMRLNEEQIVHIRRGALLHDIGKMGIPDSILLKSGGLTSAEREIMNRHPQYAYDMLSSIAFLRPALDIPWCHHEKYDGSGYPRGLKGEEIPLAARIFTVADVWDAVTFDRPYRPAWSKDKALKYMLAESGKYFDPQVVEAFLSLHLE